MTAARPRNISPTLAAGIALATSLVAFLAFATLFWILFGGVGGASGPLSLHRLGAAFTLAFLSLSGAGLAIVAALAVLLCLCFFLERRLGWGKATYALGVLAVSLLIGWWGSQPDPGATYVFTVTLSHRIEWFFRAAFPALAFLATAALFFHLFTHERASRADEPAGGR